MILREKSTATSKTDSFFLKPIRIGLIGEFQSGKSLLLNCILKQPLATVGAGAATTHTVVNYRFDAKERIEYLDSNQITHSDSIESLANLDTNANILRIDVYVSNEILNGFILSDIPGLGANNNDTWIALDTLDYLDFAIVLTSNDKVLGIEGSTYKGLKSLESRRIPYYLVLNCRDTNKWDCKDELNLGIAQTNLKNLLHYAPLKFPLNEDRINIVNLMWYWRYLREDDDPLLNSKEIKSAMREYCFDEASKEDIYRESNFNLIEQLFNMENRAFYELMSEIKKIKEEICPIGTIQAFAFNRIPDGWLICNGQSLNINEYPSLYKTIGFTYGKESDDLFKIPDLRGRFIRGWSANGDIDSNREFGSVQKDSFQNHSHEITSCSIDGNHFHTVGYKNYPTREAHTFYSTYQHEHVADINDPQKSGPKNTNYAGNHSHDINVGGARGYEEMECRVSEETRPSNIALLFCIRAN